METGPTSFSGIFNKVKTLQIDTSSISSLEGFSQPDEMNEIEANQMLRPWLGSRYHPELLKSVSVCEEMLKLDNLAKNFKCMAASCSYCTSTIDEFVNHVSSHNASVESLQCAYCPPNNYQNLHLSIHLESHHKLDSYQCCYCFYRCYLASTFRSHHAKYHSNEILRAIEVKKLKTLNKVFVLKEMQDARKKYVPVMVCEGDEEFLKKLTEFFEYLYL